MTKILKLNPTVDAKLAALAGALGISKQEALDKVIEEVELPGFREARLKEAFDKVMSRDAELMKRLGDA